MIRSDGFRPTSMRHAAIAGTARQAVVNGALIFHSVHIACIMNFTSGAPVSELLSLDRIREQLIRLEDTIIFRQFLPQRAHLRRC